MLKKLTQVFFNSIPILIMIGLIPLVKNDYLLTALYILIIIISLVIKRESGEISILVFGFIIMLIFESMFLLTNVETFNRVSLFGIMPIWLPFLWAYIFVGAKRAIKIYGLLIA